MAGEESFNSRKRLVLAIAINTAFLLAEVVFGFLARSLALQADAGHNFSDSLALFISLIASMLILKPRTHKKTFGYHRAGILAAFFNSLVLILVCLYLFYEAARRVAHPLEVRGSLVMLVAGAGFIVNGGVALALRKGRGDLNIRSAFLHLTGDALVSLGVVISGGIIFFSGWNLIDPAITCLIDLLILVSAFKVLGESVNILMEAVPHSLSYQEILDDILAFDQVRDVHDLHIWEIGSNLYALSAHIVVGDEKVSHHQVPLELIKKMLAEKHNVVHTTLELEVEPCLPGEVCHFET